MKFKSIKKHNNKNNLKKFNSKIINNICNFVNIHSELSKEEKISNNFKAFLKKLNDINQNNLYKNQFDFIIEREFEKHMYN